MSVLSQKLQRRHGWLIAASSIAVLAAFCWPFVLPATDAFARTAVPFVALALVPAVIVLVALALDGSLNTSRSIALLGVLAALGSIVRIATVGIAGVETVFIVLILAGRVLGARFGFLLGLTTIAVSSLVMGSIGPWTPFQMFACAWVGAGAGLMRFARLRGWPEIAILAIYGTLAAYLFGALMNLWFWPFAVGGGTTISYNADADFVTNISRFGLYTLLTSTLTWDTVRALTTVIGIAVVGPYVLRALRRIF